MEYLSLRMSKQIREEIVSNCEFITISVGTKWRPAQKRLSRQLRCLYKNVTIHEVNDDNLFQYLPKIADHITGEFGHATTRGNGYWIWKPLVIQQFTRDSKNQKILVYLDSGCEINQSFLAQKQFLDLVTLLD
jgi:hypothetical protein